MKRGIGLILGLILLLLAGATWWWNSRDPAPSKQSAPSVKQDPESSQRADPPALDGQLANILAEEHELRKVHRLVGWAQTQSPEALYRAIEMAPPDQQALLRWVLSRRVEQLHPDWSEEERRGLIQELADTKPESERPGREPRKPGDLTQAQKESLLARLETDPEGAIEEVLGQPMHPNHRQDFLLAMVDELAASDPQRALEIAESQPVIPWYSAVRRVMEKWGERDPAAAYAWLETMPESNRKFSLELRLIAQWRESDPEAAMQAAAGLKRSTVSLTQMLTEWFERDPVGSAHRLLAAEHVDHDLLHAGVQAVASQDPQLALQLLNKPMTYSQRLNSQLALLIRWIPNDPLAARQYVEAQPRNEAFYAMARVLGEALARQNPAEAMAFVESLPQGAAIGAIESRVASAIPDSRVALQWLLGRPASQEVTKAIASVSHDQPVENLLQLADSVPEGSRLALYTAVTDRLAGEDPARAIDYLAQWTRDGVPVQYILEEKASDLCKADPEGMMAFASKLPRGRGFQAVVNQLRMTVGRQEPERVLDWITDLPSETPDLSVNVKYLLETVAVRDVEAATHYYKQFTTPEVRTEALRGILNGISEYSPDEAARYLTAQVDDTVSPWVVSDFARTYARHSGDKAEQWIGTLPAGAMRDAGLFGVAGEIYEIAPVSATRMVAQGSTPEARADIFRRIVNKVRRQGPAAVRRTIQSLAIPADEKAALEAKWLSDEP